MQEDNSSYDRCTGHNKNDMQGNTALCTGQTVLPTAFNMGSIWQELTECTDTYAAPWYCTVESSESFSNSKLEHVLTSG